VHDAGALADGRTFYCMKLVQGQTLEQAMPAMNLRARLQLLQRIAEPLALAHSRGIIHRDLKPGNIMIGPFGEALIMDWGLARIGVQPAPAAEPEAASNGNSPGSQAAAIGHGSIMGTAGFMAPEQLRGEASAMDQRTDIYGLGALLRCLLEQPDSEKPPRALAAICAKAMAGDMTARYATAESMSADIGRYLEGLPVGAYRENLLERAERLAKRHQVAVVLVLVYLLMRALFVLFSRNA
jgi:serine/threonine protein kinase